MHAWKQLGLETYTVFSYLQTVAQPVRMEEYANVHLSVLAVSVAVGTQETTAREQVATATAQLSTYLHAQSLCHETLTLCVSYVFAACSPACQNGGTCHIDDSYFLYYLYCVCPSGYKGSYCQYRGICAHTTDSFYLSCSPWFMNYIIIYAL